MGDTYGEQVNIKQKKILILTSDAGFGHRSASEAIKFALQDKYGAEALVTIANPLDFPETSGIIQQLEENYDNTVIDTPGYYQLTYDVLDMRVISGVVRSVTSRMLKKAMIRCIQEAQPDIVVSTYPFFSEATAKAVEFSKRDIPLVVVITDLMDVFRLWYSPMATIHFVPTSHIRDQAIKKNVPATRVRVTGLPIHPRFAAEKREKQHLRGHLGWEKALPSILIVASKRTRLMTLISEKLNGLQADFQLAVVCGGNLKMYEQLQKISWNMPTRFYHWVDNMHEVMKASDMIITKAGGLIVSESLACGLPMIIPESLPGQEKGNVRYVVDYNAGAWAPDPDKVTETVISWLRNNSLVELQENAKRIGRPLAAYDIAEGVWGMIQ